MKKIRYLICLLVLLIVVILFVPSGVKTSSSNGMLNWKGQNWSLTSGYANPGNNSWNETGAWTDDQNRLHLTIVNDKGTWKCTMLSSQNQYHYGTFTWTVDSPVYTFDKNSVIGFCTYLNDSREINIVNSRWGEANEDQLWYTIEPSKIEGNSKGYLVPSSTIGKNITYIIEWKPTYVRFTSIAQDGTVIADYNNTNASVIPKEPESVIMNLWLTAPPSNGKNIELIINDFKVSSN